MGFALQKPPGLFSPLDRKSPTRSAIIRGMKNQSAPRNLEVEADGPVAAAQVTIKLRESSRPSTLQFQEIPIGQFFELHGRRYGKLALSMASDEDRNGNIFQAQTEVLPDPFSRSDPGPEGSYVRRQSNGSARTDKPHVLPELPWCRRGSFHIGRSRKECRRWGQDQAQPEISWVSVDNRRSVIWGGCMGSSGCAKQQQAPLMQINAPSTKKNWLSETWTF